MLRKSIIKLHKEIIEVGIKQLQIHLYNKMIEWHIQLFVRDLRQVDDVLRVLRFILSIKFTAMK